MPTYAYHCEECGHEMDAFQKITDAHLSECPKCQQHKLKRGPGGGIGLAFKGSGFYITDYAGKKDNCPCGSDKSCKS